MDRPALPAGPFLVAGLGRAGRAAADALRRAAGPERGAAWDSESTSATRAAARRLEAVGVRTRLGPAPPSREALRSFRTLVKSPGIALDSAVVTRALDSGLDVIDELELGWRMSQAPTLAVTGTNGKSTVATLAAAVLEAAGMEGRLAGNAEFGTPLSAVATEPAGWNVCEVSSFQLEASPGFLPDVAVFTNLTRDHLSRHRTMRSYGDAKRRMFVRADAVVSCAVVDTDDRFGDALADQIEAAGGRVVRVGSSAAADYRVVAAAWDLRRARVRLDTPSGELTLETRLPGLYNARNAAAALAAVETIGVHRAVAARAIAGQDGVPGR